MTKKSLGKCPICKKWGWRIASDSSRECRRCGYIEYEDDLEWNWIDDDCYTQMAGTD